MEWDGLGTKRAQLVGTALKNNRNLNGCQNPTGLLITWTLVLGRWDGANLAPKTATGGGSEIQLKVLAPIRH